MKKEIKLNNDYYVKTDIIESSKAIKVQAFLKKPSMYDSDVKLYETTVYENRLLEVLGITFEQRLENKIRRAIILVNKFDEKTYKLQIADKNCNDTFNLDKHMDV